MLVGYMRVSKADGSQVLDLQKDALIAAGVETAAIYQDMASGAKDDRPGLASCLKSLRNGDVLVIWKLDRLGRNLLHLIETVEDLNRRGIGLKVLQGAPVDTTTSQGKLMFTMFAALAEFERDVIRERTIAGLAAARARGKEGGRRSAFDKTTLLRAQAAMRNRDCSVSDLCAELGISKPTLYRNLTPAGELTEAGQRVVSGKRAKLKKERRGA
jgi:DNA invertase Pin-like site-specific DNA recombinase